MTTDVKEPGADHSADKESATRALCEQAQAGDVNAKQRLLSLYEELVVQISEVFKGTGIDCETLKAAGRKGLLRAILRFAPDEDRWSFSEYASNWIASFIQSAVHEEPLHEKLSREDLRLLRGLARVARGVIDNGVAKEDVPREVAKIVGLDIERVEILLARRGYELYFDAPPRQQQGVEGGDSKVVSSQEFKRRREFKKRLDHLEALIKELPEN